jgi:hypothetical protein
MRYDSAGDLKLPFKNLLHYAIRGVHDVYGHAELKASAARYGSRAYSGLANPRQSSELRLGFLAWPPVINQAT